MSIEQIVGAGRNFTRVPEIVRYYDFAIHGILTPVVRVEVCHDLAACGVHSPNNCYRPFPAEEAAIVKCFCNFGLCVNRSDFEMRFLEDQLPVHRADVVAVRLPTCIVHSLPMHLTQVIGQVQYV